MKNLAMILIGLSALSFLLAVIFCLVGTSVAGVSPEGFSRACTNLALLAIALAVWFKEGVQGKVE